MATIFVCSYRSQRRCRRRTPFGLINLLLSTSAMCACCGPNWCRTESVCSNNIINKIFLYSKWAQVCSLQLICRINSIEHIKHIYIYTTSKQLRNSHSARPIHSFITWFIHSITIYFIVYHLFYSYVCFSPSYTINIYYSVCYLIAINRYEKRKLYLIIT